MTPIAPVPGLVIRYNYLWSSEKDQGLPLGRKDRPCAIIVHHAHSGDTIVVPITHSPPAAGEEHLSIEIPPEVSSGIGLDHDINWVRVSEVNRFVWPSPHLRTLPADPTRHSYGMIPRALFEVIKGRLIEAVQRGRVSSTRR